MGNRTVKFWVYVHIDNESDGKRTDVVGLFVTEEDARQYAHCRNCYGAWEEEVTESAERDGEEFDLSGWRAEDHDDCFRTGIDFSGGYPDFIAELSTSGGKSSLNEYRECS